MNDKTFTTYLNLSTNIFFSCDTQGTITDAPTKTSEFFGVADINHMHLSDFFDENNSKLLCQKITEVLQNKKNKRLSLADKFSNYVLYLTPCDEKVCFCLENISEREHLSALLGKTWQRLEFAEKTAAIGYWEIDLATRETYWSTEMYRLFGQIPHQKLKKHNIITEYMQKEDWQAYKQNIKNVLRRGTPTEGQARLQDKEGRIIYCQYNAGLLRENGKHKLAGTFQDISKLIETQNALKIAKEEAERANQEKSYFLAQASHDLRQPMQALKLYLSTLAETPMHRLPQELISKAEISAENLRLMLDNFLDISQLEVGGIKYFPCLFNVHIMLHRIAAEATDLAAERQIKFSCLGQGQTVWSDPVLVERIIRNLLGNALKFTKNKIILGSRREEKHLRIMILDNGSGILPEEKELILKEFYQSNRHKKHHHQGSGLGLAIVSKLLDLIGSKLEIASIPERGSCFSFTLSLDRPQK